MVSKNQIKLITGLQQKKYRKEHKLFFAEGVKVVKELLNSNFELQHLYTTDDIFDTVGRNKITLIADSELKKISALVTPNVCLALFKIKEEKFYNNTGLTVVLDNVRDPGNMGTIIRLCDWFGIKQLVCSESSVDIYNPKVVQATMGSIARVNVIYADLGAFLKDSAVPVYGTFMEGENIYTQKLPESGIIVMGNEANGISPDIEALVSHKIAIPRFGDLQETESLNVATAAAIILSEFRRDFSEK